MTQALGELGLDTQKMAEKLTRAITKKSGRQVGRRLESSIEKAFRDGAKITGGIISTRALEAARNLADEDSKSV